MKRGLCMCAYMIMYNAAYFNNSLEVITSVEYGTDNATVFSYMHGYQKFVSPTMSVPSLKLL